MTKTQRILAYIKANPGTTTRQVAAAIGDDIILVQGTMSTLSRRGVVVGTETARSISNRPIFGWTVSEAKAKKTTKAPTRNVSSRNFDAILDSLAAGLVESLVQKVRARLPQALAAVAPPEHLVREIAQTIDIKLPAPAPAKPQAVRKPVVGVVGLLPIQAGALSQEFGEHLDLRFWKEEGTPRLKAIADAADVVFFHTDHSSHTTDNTLRAYAYKVKKVPGGVSSMKTLIRAHFQGATA